jgi:hypothetical protein
MQMRLSLRALALLTLFCSLSTPAFAGRKKQTPSPQILSAKTVYFRDQTGDDAVGKRALEELRKWGRFQIVSDREDADLVFVLTSDPYRGGLILLANGRTASVDVRGRVEADAIPKYNTRSPSRFAYLTVVDAETGEQLWSGEHVWGGLLTGFNSAGVRLIKNFEKQNKK